jgi:hypothetical protein
MGDDSAHRTADRWRQSPQKLVSDPIFLRAVVAPAIIHLPTSSAVLVAITAAGCLAKFVWPEVAAFDAVDGSHHRHRDLPKCGWI